MYVPQVVIIIIVAPLGTISILRGCPSSCLTNSVGLSLASCPGEVPLVLHEEGGVVTSLIASAPGPPVITSVPDVPVVPVGLRLHKRKGGGD